MLHFAGYGYPAVGKIRIWMHISESNIPTDAKQSKLNYMHDPGLHIWNISFPTFLFWLCIKKISSKFMCQDNWIYQYPPNFDEHFAQELVPVWEWIQQIIQCFCFLNFIFLFWPIGKCQNHADILRWHWSWVSQSRGKFKTKSVWGGRRGNTLLLI